MRQETKISLAWELMEQGVPKSHIAKLEISRRTVIRWGKAFRPHSNLAFWSNISKLNEALGGSANVMLICNGGYTLYGLNTGIAAGKSCNTSLRRNTANG